MREGPATGSVTVSKCCVSSESPCDHPELPKDVNRFVDRTVIVFDWDDTLFASSAATPNGLCIDGAIELDGGTQSDLIELETLVISLLSHAMRLGRVVIITNSEMGWVELCGDQVTPRLLNFLQRNDIPVISARYFYQHRFPRSPIDWKAQAFLDHLSPMYSSTLDMNLLVFGDGRSERNAAHVFASHRPSARVKTVKFIDRPSIDELMQQISLLKTSLEFVRDHDGSFDIDLNFRSKTTDSRDENDV